METDHICLTSDSSYLAPALAPLAFDPLAPESLVSALLAFASAALGLVVPPTFQ